MKKYLAILAIATSSQLFAGDFFDNFHDRFIEEMDPDSLTNQVKEINKNLEKIQEQQRNEAIRAENNRLFEQLMRH